jgi:hypothetical protein
MKRPANTPTDNCQGMPKRDGTVQPTLACAQSDEQLYTEARLTLLVPHSAVELCSTRSLTVLNTTTLYKYTKILHSRYVNDLDANTFDQHKSKPPFFAQLTPNFFCIRMFLY